MTPADVARLKSAQRYAERVAAGLCPCGQEPPRPGRVTGQRCAERKRGYYVPTGRPVGRRPAPLGDRWAALFTQGAPPADIARAEGVAAARVRDALAARGLWTRTPMKRRSS